MSMFPSSTVGRKLLMAASGQLLLLFILLHVLGNSTIYSGGLNAYAASLHHALAPVLWSVRLALIVLFPLHIYFGIVLSLENNAARPHAYRMKQNLSSSFAGRNAVWTGAVIGTFLVFHLLHFTFQVIEPSLGALRHPDMAGRPDLTFMVTSAFHQPLIVAVYLLGVAALWLHLSHGIESSFQTWGLNGERSFPYIQTGGTVAAIVLFLAYAAIPITIFTGLLLR